MCSLIRVHILNIAFQITSAKRSLSMKRIYILLTLMMSLCIELIGSGIVKAQDSAVILAENYTSAPDRVAFFYPTGWVVDKQTSFVSVSDTKMTIEFYTASLSQGGH